MISSPFSDPPVTAISPGSVFLEVAVTIVLVLVAVVVAVVVVTAVWWKMQIT